MRAIWSFMDLRQRYWLRQSRGRYCCQRSIKLLLPNIIGQYLLYYMSNVYGSSTLVYGYIYCEILLNILLTFHVLKSWAWCYYCDVRYHSIPWVTFLSNNSTIWRYNSTIWCHNSSTMRTGNIEKYCLVNMVFLVSMHHYERSCDQVLTNQRWVFMFNI